jgi:xanthine/uracil/vitamin C permease (AzgA family)
VKAWLNRYFKLEENNTGIRTEMVGGITTFMTMCYIIFVQPAILSVAGVWKSLLAAVPDSLKHAVAVGIGLLIALVGPQYGGISNRIAHRGFYLFFTGSV